MRNPIDTSQLFGLEGCAIGSYLLDEIVGTGASSVVYAGRRRIAGAEQRVALKLLANVSDPDTTVRLYLQECAAQAKLDSPNITRLLDFGQIPSVACFVVTDLVDGQSLCQFCSNEGTSIEERLALFIAVLQAVAHAHSRGVIHGDLKPAHVLVGADRVPKLIDFGVAHVRSGDCTAVERHVYLTPEYAAPERYSGICDELSDIYSLGIILRDLLAPIFSTHNRRIEDLSSIVHKATAERHERYATANAFLEDIKDYLACRPISARKASSPYRLRLFVRRRRREVTATSVLLVLVLSVMGLMIYARGARSAANQHVAELVRLVASDTERRSDAETAAERDARFREITESLASLQVTEMQGRTALSVVQMYADAGDIAGNAFAENNGDSARAKSLYNRALSILASALPNDDLRARAWTASLKRRLGDLATLESDTAAIGLYEAAYRECMQLKTLRFRPEWISDELIRVLHQQAYWSEALGDFSSALKKCQAALAEAKIFAEHNATAGRVAEAAAMARYGGMLGKATKPGASVYMARATDTFKELLRETPNDYRRRYELANVLLEWAELLPLLAPERELHYREAAELLKGLCSADPTNPQYPRNLAQAYWGLSEELASRRLSGEAAACARSATAVLEPLVSRAQPSSYDVQLYGWIVLNSATTAEQSRKAARLIHAEVAGIGDPPPPLLDLQARAFDRSGDLVRAIAAQKRAIAALPEGSDRSEYTSYLADLNTRHKNAPPRTDIAGRIRDR